MKVITVAGPPSSGKTSVILKTIREIGNGGIKVGVVKLDGLTTNDDRIYRNAGLDVLVGLAGSLCPDHYFINNIEECVTWGKSKQLDLLVSESAGLCNRCSPYIKGIPAVCIIDNLMGTNTPQKIGPMLKKADIVVITKGDIVSQAEREVFAFRVRQVNPKSTILHINGITGQGAYELSRLFLNSTELDTLSGKELRSTMPKALCPYCYGERHIGKDFQMGNVRKIDLSQD